MKKMITINHIFDTNCSRFCRWLFWWMEHNHSPNSHQKIWRINGLRTGAFLRVIFDIHKIHTNPEDPMDIRNDPQKGILPQAVCSSNFLMWLCGVISFLSSKKSPLQRKMSFYIVTYYLPSGLFVVVSWISFLVNPEVIPGRMTLLVTIFLVLINIFNTIQTNSPKAEGLTGRTLNSFTNLP